MSELAVIVDTETARIREPVPLEVAMITVTMPPDLIGGVHGSAFHKRYNPGCDIEYGAVAAHNIIPEDIFDAPPWVPGSIDIKAQYVVGHNVDFDLEALYGAKDKIPERLKRICTLALSRWAFPDLDSHKLAAMMYCCFGQNDLTREQVKHAHGALPDAMMCMRLTQFIAHHFKIHTWEALWQQSEIARLPTRMSFGKYGPKDGQPGMLLTDMAQKDRGYIRWLFGLPDLDPYLRKALEKL